MSFGGHNHVQTKKPVLFFSCPLFGLISWGAAAGELPFPFHRPLLDTPMRLFFFIVF